MNKFTLSVAVSALLTVAASAQQPEIATEEVHSLGQLAPTPDMWFYQQELKRREDPRVAVRAKAEHRAWHRQRRIAAMQWFGMSNSRPTANPTPLLGTYSPTWVASPHSPFQWSGQGSAVTVYTVRRAHLGYGLW